MAKKVESPRTKSLMCVAKKVVAHVSCGDLYLAGQHLDSGGWLDYYTYEGNEFAFHAVRAAIEAVKKIARDDETDWKWRVFTSDGFVRAAWDGSSLDEDDCPIAGTNVFSSM